MEAPKQVMSPSEEKFESLRQKVGVFLGPLVFLIIWFYPIEGLSVQAHRLLAIFFLVVIYWITEAIPMAVTALLIPTLAIICGVDTAKAIFKNFGDPIIFLFVGSFILAEAMLLHGLNRRIAFGILALPGVGNSSGRLLLAFAFIGGFISMWISNTATTAMMFPIGLAILSEMARRASVLRGREIKYTDLKYGTGLMLIASFAPSIGGLGTPVGTPPNLIGIALINKHLNVEISFLQWMLLGIPLASILILICVLYFHWIGREKDDFFWGDIAWILDQKKSLGPLRKAEKNVLFAFTVTVLLWVLPGFIVMLAGSEAAISKWLTASMPESVAALTGAMLLFFLPVDYGKGKYTVTWKEAKNIDWGIILLFGGGLALGDLMFSTGLSHWMGKGVADLCQANTTFLLVLLFTTMAIFVSEMASNTASATMIVPVAIAVSQAAQVNPLQPALAACIASSFGFMLPVSTAPNAMVYGSGCIPLLKMIRHGLLLDLVGILVIVTFTMFFVPLIFR